MNIIQYNIKYFEIFKLHFILHNLFEPKVVFVLILNFEPFYVQISCEKSYVRLLVYVINQPSQKYFYLGLTFEYFKISIENTEGCV